MNAIRKTDYIFSAVKTFDLNTKSSNELKPHPAAKLITKIYKNDSVILLLNNVENIFILKSIRAANKQLYFLKSSLNKEREGQKQFLLTFSKLADYKFRKVHITPAGKVIDNGPLLK
jgi:hypothetical protein